MEDVKLNEKQGGNAKIEDVHYMEDLQSQLLHFLENLCRKHHFFNASLK